MINEHRPVLLEQAIEGLAIKSDGIYVDATFGRGGHASAILKKLSNKGQLFALDKDPKAVEVAKELFGKDERFHIWHGSFTEISEFLKSFKIHKVDGILLDLGVSSPQLEDAQRGFSFLKDGPLDMRMDPTIGMSAKDWINQVDEKILANVLKTYGEERFAKRIAKAIVRERKNTPIIRTKQLSEIIAAANPRWEKKKHPATRSFQAIRIFINKELEELETCLKQCLELLKPQGRLVVISFHSLEDRMVKQFIKRFSTGEALPLGLPVRQKDLQLRLKKIGRLIQPDEQEIADNPRSRSAVLRIAEKTNECCSSGD